MAKKNKNNRFNETKYVVLRCLSRADKHLTPSEIAWECDLTLHSVKCALARLYKWNYIWRSKDRRKTRNWYIYRRLKRKGQRVYFECRRRKTIEELTHIDVSLNLKKPIPLKESIRLKIEEKS